MVDFELYNSDPLNYKNIAELASLLSHNGMHDLALLFANKLISLDITDEYRIIAYTVISISAFYSKDPKMHKLGKHACELLSLTRSFDIANRQTPRQNASYYAASANSIMPTTRFYSIKIQTDNNYNQLNPSVCFHNGELWMIQRTVNYVIRNDGSYDMNGDDDIKTINYFVKLDQNYQIVSSSKITLPVMPVNYKDVLGFEDSRLFFFRGDAWCTSTVRQLSPTGDCEIVLAKINNFETAPNISEYEVLRPQFLPLQNEKNWMPFIDNNTIKFLYSCDPVRIIDVYGQCISETKSPIASDSFRGGGNLIKFEDGWLGIIHESILMNDYRRRYLHRFVFFDDLFTLSKITELFYFKEIGIEFAAGLAINNETFDIVVGFGLYDKESWLAIFDPSEIRRNLKPV